MDAFLNSAECATGPTSHRISRSDYLSVCILQMCRQQLGLVWHLGPFYCWGYQWHYVFTGLQDIRSECHCCCIRLMASSWIEDCLLRTLLTRSTQRSSIPLFQLPVCCIPVSAKGMCLMNLGHTPIVLRSRSFWDHACRKTHVSDQRSYLAMRLAFHWAIVPQFEEWKKASVFF